MKSEDLCQILHCKSYGEIIYFGRMVCNGHWDRYTQDKPPGSLRRALGIPQEDEMAKSRVKRAPRVRVDLSTMKSKLIKPGRGKIGITSKLRVAQYWAKLLKENHTKHLTDKQLAETMTKEFPGGKTSYDVLDVRTHRSLYNKGKLRFQEVVPSTPVHEFDAKGTALPLWGEKSKLKTTAKKPVPDDLKFGKKPVVKIRKRKSA
jgi:hypothetical protein